MTTTNLTPAQHTILAEVINISGGRIDRFSGNIRGDAYKKALDGVFNHVLIANDGTNQFITAEGCDALGVKRPDVTPSIPEANAELEYAVATAEATRTPAPVQAKPHTCDNSKQAEVIWMLQCPEGATIGQICTAAGWQTHTVRDIFAGTSKKRLSLAIVSNKPQGGGRVYRIT